MKEIKELRNGVIVAVVSKNGQRDVYMFNAYFEFEGKQLMSYHAYLDYDGEVVDEPGATLYDISFDTIEAPTAEEIEMFESHLNEKGLYFDEENGILAGY